MISNRKYNPRQPPKIIDLRPGWMDARRFEPYYQHRTGANQIFAASREGEMTMDILMAISVVAAYIALQVWILPRLGIPT